MFPLNVPNVLTLVRILLVPVLVVALLDETPNGDLFAAIVFAIASLTDFVDGWIARSRNAVTTFGKLMDPVADKLLIIAALFSLVSLDRLAPWIAMVIVAREFAVSGLRMIAASTEVIAANRLGKLKTLSQMVAILALMLNTHHDAVNDVLVGIAVVLTLASAVQYFYAARGHLVGAAGDPS